MDCSDSPLEAFVHDLERLVAIEDIRRLKARYCYCVDTPRLGRISSHRHRFRQDPEAHRALKQLVYFRDRGLPASALE